MNKDTIITIIAIIICGLIGIIWGTLNTGMDKIVKSISGMEYKFMTVERFEYEMKVHELKCGCREEKK